MVRLTCPMGRKRAELWSGAVLALAGAGGAAAAYAGLWGLPEQGALHWGAAALGVAVLAAGLGLLADGLRLRVPVLEVEDGEFRYTRGRYIVRIPFADVGSYYVLRGRTRSLGLCDVTGRPRQFPSVQGRRASRPYLPLTGLTSPDKVDAFMSTAGIPPRSDRSLTSGR
ncbi:hypothetical protein RM446_19390 [Streptomonospora sp. DSM 45055]|uniref:PH domain-containing protein n=2 Tax=Streptomonospora wellingtoniae TaxID=3075544 RepID=A0ABU2KYG0_9ACTN|nr:hypothetical protein [Streptomonospora sp. DSM 45055]MDT0304287.1 hypothetical protein [Streptomonospora sp. DSM 45055]